MDLERMESIYENLKVVVQLRATGANIHKLNNLIQCMCSAMEERDKQEFWKCEKEIYKLLRNTPPYLKFVGMKKI